MRQADPAADGRVVTTDREEDPTAYSRSLLNERRVITDHVAGKANVVLRTPGTASALEAHDMPTARTARCHRGVPDLRREAGPPLQPPGEARLRDAETNSTWTVLGKAVAGRLEGQQLERVPHDDTFWFVQYAFRPDTRVIRS